MVTLSVLDQSPIRRGGTAAQALRETIELARLTDRLGYHRYWLAEHHGSGGLACSSPEVMIGQVAANTTGIRVGSGGVMLTHYSPLKVAENFRMLEALFPGRIDLGVGRAPGSDTRTDQALAVGPGKLPLDHYPEQLMDLYGYLSDDLPPEHPFRSVRATPSIDTRPELWMLGSSDASARYAAELGWPFCFAHFINPEGGERWVRWYQQYYQPSPVSPEPRASIGVSVTCAGTDEEAERLSWSRWASRVIGNRGVGGGSGVMAPEEAMSFAFTEPERDYIEFMKTRSVHGGPAKVKRMLLELTERFNVDEVVAVTITYDFEARKRSYELLAEAFALTPRA